MVVSFALFGLKESYKKVCGLGDRLNFMNDLIDWECFRPLIKCVFLDDKKVGGRPHTDEIIVIKSLVLQSCYNLSDQELEFQVNDRLSFRNFLGFPERVPDFTTIWKIRERLKNQGVDKIIWQELQNQLKNQGYKIKKGMIQDAAFIESDLGRKRHYHEKKAKKKGEKIVYTKKQKQHMDKDASFSIKHNQVHYGYKNHIKIDREHQLIRSYEVTTAKVHDNRIDLSEKNEVVYRDRGYTGTKTKTIGNATMKRGKLTIKEKNRNKRISRKRVIGERPFSVIKRVFKAGHTLVKTLTRVKIKTMFQNFAYNLYQLFTLHKKKTIATAT